MLTATEKETFGYIKTKISPLEDRLIQHLKNGIIPTAASSRNKPLDNHKKRTDPSPMKPGRLAAYGMPQRISHSGQFASPQDRQNSASHTVTSSHQTTCIPPEKLHSSDYGTSLFSNSQVQCHPSIRQTPAPTMQLNNEISNSASMPLRPNVICKMVTPIKSPQDPPTEIYDNNSLQEMAIDNSPLQVPQYSNEFNHFDNAFYSAIDDTTIAENTTMSTSKFSSITNTSSSLNAIEYAEKREEPVSIVPASLPFDTTFPEYPNKRKRTATDALDFLTKKEGSKDNFKKEILTLKREKLALKKEKFEFHKKHTELQTRYQSTKLKYLERIESHLVCLLSANERTPDYDNK